jgi:phage protein D
MATVVPHPIVIITFDGQSSSSLQMPTLLECTYTDKVHGESDELNLKYEDRNGVIRNTLFGRLNNTIHAQIGYEGQPLLDCGDFQVEEVEFSGKPDEVDIKAVGTHVSKSLRTKKHKAFEGEYLSMIVYRIAADNGLTVKGNIEKIMIDRSTQNHERDLQYLLRLSKDYGYAFVVKGTDLIYYKMEELENTPAQILLLRTQIEEYELKFKTIDTYKDANVSHHRHKSKSKVNGKIGASDIRTPTAVQTPDGYPVGFLGHANDSLTVISRSQDDELAKIKARSKLHLKNREECTGSFTIKGDTRFLAGITFELSGMGMLGGPYFIEQVDHSVKRSDGYVTKLEVKRPPDPSKVAKKK